MTSLRQQPRLVETAQVPLSACTLTDLTDLPRVGFRGAESADYLRGREFVLPEKPNCAVIQTDGSLVARLSQTEYLLLGGNDQGERIADEEARWELDHRANYLLPRQDSHGCFHLSGERISQIMAKLCGVDLRVEAFGFGVVAQTSAARINVIIINSGNAQQPGFHILFDRPSKAYFHDALIDAMQEFGGQ